MDVVDVSLGARLHNSEFGLLVLLYNVAKSSFLDDG